MGPDMRDWRVADPEELRARPGVRGIGFGVRVLERSGEVFPLPVVKVFVAEKLSDEALGPGERVPSQVAVEIPSALGGVRVFDLATDVVALDQVGPPGAEAEFPGQASAGDAVFAPGAEFGTAGCLAVSRSSGAPVLVTCHHVVFGDSQAQAPGAVAPGRTLRMNLLHRDGTVTDEEVGQVLTAARQEGPVHLDVAVARITRRPSADGPVRALRGLGRQPRRFVGDGENLINRRLVKSGAATGVTCGIVTARASELALPDGRVVRDIWVIQNMDAGPCTRCPVPHAPSPIATDADSGSVFITDETEPRIAGLLWGGNRQRIAYATPWATIERALGLDVTLG